MFIECRHILPRGTKCKSPALRDRVYCYFHDRLKRFEQDGQRAEREPLYLPSIEDARGIQMAITQILAALGSGRVENRSAGLYLYGLQLATQLLAQLPEPSPQEMVRTLTVGEDGNYIAAEETPFAPLIEGHDGGKIDAGELLRLDNPGPDKLWFDTRGAEQPLESESTLH
jgi:hypothetical protein